jgi:tRNA 2-thiouridine synthesizing protein A
MSAGAQQRNVHMDIREIKPDAVLDCVGLACPMPIFKTADRIKELETGQVLEVQSDDDGIEKDMPAWCRMTGHEYLGLTKLNGEYHVYVRKK